MEGKHHQRKLHSVKTISALVFLFHGALVQLLMCMHIATCTVWWWCLYIILIVLVQVASSFIIDHNHHAHIHSYSTTATHDHHLHMYSHYHSIQPPSHQSPPQHKNTTTTTSPSILGKGVAFKLQTLEPRSQPCPRKSWIAYVYIGHPELQKPSKWFCGQTDSLSR